MKKAPETCTSMTDLRVEIDRIDVAMVALLAERATYIDRAAEIKQGVGLPARIPARVEQVVRNVRAASRGGFDADMAEVMWRELIEWSIRREEAALAAKKAAE
jgi:isochorismate pyruvate lyase